MDIEARIETFKTWGIDEILKSDDKRTKFAQFYRSVFGEKICLTCDNRFTESFTKLIQIPTKQLEKMKDRNFTLKAGSLIDTSMKGIPGVPMHVSDANLTDDIAIQLLKANKGYIMHFDHKPSNWEEVVAKGVKAKPTPTVSQPGGTDSPGETTTEPTGEEEKKFEELKVSCKENKGKCESKDDFNELIGVMDEQFPKDKVEEEYGALGEKVNKWISSFKSDLRAKVRKMEGAEIAALESLEGVDVGSSNQHAAKDVKTIISKMDNVDLIQEYGKKEKRDSVNANIKKRIEELSK